MKRWMPAIRVLTLPPSWEAHPVGSQQPHAEVPTVTKAADPNE